MSLGDPYRPPCGGWDEAKKELEGCFSHYDKRDNGYPEFPDGWPRYANTTKISKVTTEDPEGDPVTEPPEQVCPYPIPRCWDDGMSAPDCVSDLDFDEKIGRVTNTYALPDGMTVTDCNDAIISPSTVNYATCKKRGFKNVQARKAWHGRFGFDTLVDGVRRLGSNRYLTKTMSAFVVNDNGIGHVVTTTVSRTYTVERYTGKVVEVSCVDDQDIVGEEFDNGCINAAAELSGVKGMLASLDYQDGEWIGTGPGGDLNDPNWGNNLSFETGTKSVNETTIEIEYSFDVSECTDDCPPECTEQTYSISILIELSDIYTPAQVVDDLQTLLACWDLDDDVVYPWREDVEGELPITSLTQGPSYAPLVTFDEKGQTLPDVFLDCGYVDESTVTGEVLGKPVHLVVAGLVNRGGNDRFWNSTHQNWTYEFIEDIATFCWKHTSWGAYAPDWCPNATQWTEDVSFQRYPEGAFLAYNYFLDQNSNCLGPDVMWLGGYVIMTKWAETVYFKMPSHNYARPCGPEDQATIDPDTIDCSDDGFGGFVNPGQLRWPDAPASCEGVYAEFPDGNSYLQNDTDKKGDFCVKSWEYDFRSFAEVPGLLTTLSSMTCDQTCGGFSVCHPTAVHIQEVTPTREDSIHIANNTVDFLDEEYGTFKIIQLGMHMIDPLWKQPRFPCTDEDNPGELDPDACTPFEECRDCGDGTCEDYVDRVNGSIISTNSRCEPQDLLQAWRDQTVEECEEELELP